MRTVAARSRGRSPARAPGRRSPRAQSPWNATHHRGPSRVSRDGVGVRSRRPFDGPGEPEMSRRGCGGRVEAPTQSGNTTRHRGPFRASRDGSEPWGCGGRIGAPTSVVERQAWRAARSRARRRRVRSSRAAGTTAHRSQERIAPAPHQREEADDQHHQQQRRARQQERADADRVAEHPVGARECPGDAPAVEGDTGTRLKRFSSTPCGRARRAGLLPRQPGAEDEPCRQRARDRAAIATRASTAASRGWPCMATKAPTKGMNTGAPAGMPSRRSATACPISWTKISRTKPGREGPTHSMA